LLALASGLAPPTANLAQPDEKIDVDLVAGAPRAREMHYGLSNSFGFGGQNVTLIMGR